ncbi:MAG: hypothetical protein PHW76_07170 [Alphaproteobacteria bacterium]|nr:hypothetical protein [Alphaproteobacteria bacterium]
MTRRDLREIEEFILVGGDWNSGFARGPNNTTNPVHTLSLEDLSRDDREAAVRLLKEKYDISATLEEPSRKMLHVESTATSKEVAKLSAVLCLADPAFWTETEGEC